MPATPQPGPLERLSWLDRRRWSRRARKVVRQFEADTLADLQSLAGSGVALEWMSHAASGRAALAATAGAGKGASSVLGPGLAGPVEFSAGGRRVVAGAVWAPAWESLVGTWRNTVVTLAGAGRYHRSWVLRFRVAATSGPQTGVVREFVLLASRVRLIDHLGGSRGHGEIFGPPLTPLALT
ncbi:MAG TPA: hypothetical protein VFJ79_06785 [Acidimicrobiales bacterium]|nr:hypothetical protein [Acidimicrobiales bacterium]